MEQRREVVEDLVNIHSRNPVDLQHRRDREEGQRAAKISQVLLHLKAKKRLQRRHLQGRNVVEDLRKQKRRSHPSLLRRRRKKKRRKRKRRNSNSQIVLPHKPTLFLPVDQSWTDTPFPYTNATIPQFTFTLQCPLVSGRPAHFMRLLCVTSLERLQILYVHTWMHASHV